MNLKDFFDLYVYAHRQNSEEKLWELYLSEHCNYTKQISFEDLKKKVFSKVDSHKNKMTKTEKTHVKKTFERVLNKMKQSGHDSIDDFFKNTAREEDN